jgi:hypothetical protein
LVAVTFTSKYSVPVGGGVPSCTLAFAEFTRTTNRSMMSAAVPSGIGRARVSPTAKGTNVAAARIVRPPKMSLRPCDASSTHVGFFVFWHARRQPVNFQPLYGFALRTTRGLFNRKLTRRHDALTQRVVG